MSTRHTPPSAHPALHDQGCGTSGCTFSLRYSHPARYRGPAAAPQNPPLRPGRRGHKSGWVSFRPCTASQALGGRVLPWSSRRSSLAHRSAASEAAVGSARSVSKRRSSRNRPFSPQAACLGWTEVSAAEVLREGRACGIRLPQRGRYFLAIVSSTLTDCRGGGPGSLTTATAPFYLPPCRAARVAPCG